MSDVRIHVAGAEFWRWNRYEIESDLMSPSDAFSFAVPNTGAADLAVLEPGAEVTVLVDGVVQMTGWIDEVRGSVAPDGATLEISGRDRFGQLVDVSAQPKTYRNVTLLDLAQALASAWVPSWEVDNEANRVALLRAKSALAAIVRAQASKPAQADAVTQYGDEVLERRQEIAQANVGKIKRRVFVTAKVEPGDTPFDVLQRHAERAGLMLWQTADGKGIIARPNYNQPALYSLHLHPESSPQSARNNVLRAEVTRSIRDRYRTYELYGTHRNSKADGGGKSSHKRASAEDDGCPVANRMMLMQKDSKKLAEALDNAKREMQRRRFEGTELQYTVAGHQQAGVPWQIDTLCAVHDSVHHVDGIYYVTARRFIGDDRGQTTLITLRESGVLCAD